MKELENWTPEPVPERPDSALNPFLDRIIRQPVTRKSRKIFFPGKKPERKGRAMA